MKSPCQLSSPLMSRRAYLTRVTLRKSDILVSSSKRSFKTFVSFALFALAIKCAHGAESRPHKGLFGSPMAATSDSGPTRTRAQVWEHKLIPASSHSHYYKVARANQMRFSLNKLVADARKNTSYVTCVNRDVGRVFSDESSLSMFDKNLGTTKNLGKLRKVLLAYCQEKSTTLIQGAPTFLAAILLQVYEGKEHQVNLTFRSLIVVMAKEKYGELIDPQNFSKIVDKLLEKLRGVKSLSKDIRLGIGYWITQHPIQSGLFSFPGIPEHVIWRLWDRYIASGCDNDRMLDFCVELFRANERKVKKRSIPFALLANEIFFTKKHFEKALGKSFLQHSNSICQACKKKKLRKWFGSRHTCRLCGYKICGSCSLYLEKEKTENRICKSCVGENNYSKPKVVLPRRRRPNLPLPKPHWLQRASKGAVAGA